MRSGAIAVAGLLVGLAGVGLAVAVRERWGRPLGALLLAAAVVAEVFAVSARSPSSAAGGGGPTVGVQIGGSAPPASSQPSHSPGNLPSIPILPHLLAGVHPGWQAVVRASGVNHEFVKLQNTGTQSFYMLGWTLSNGSLLYHFPGVTLKPHQTLSVRSGPGSSSFSTDQIVLHWNQTHYVWPHVG